MHPVCVRLVTLRMHTPSIVAGIELQCCVQDHPPATRTRTGLGMRLPPGSGNEAITSTEMGLGMRLPPVLEWVWE